MKRLLLVSLLLSATAAFADLYDQPYSIIQTDASRSSDHLLRPVIVNRVDGQNAQYDNRAVVGPGRHAVTIDLPPRQGYHTATQLTFDLETKPCTRYYVAARLDNSAGQRWKPVVRSQEPIGECEAKFKVAGAK
jgi:hypothetical protein